VAVIVCSLSKKFIFAIGFRTVGNMAYTRENLLQRMIDIQNVTLEHTQKGVTQEWVFNNQIKPFYRISRKTYYNYLSVPAKKQLKQLREIKEMQMQLF